jgi:hypothetical protein
MDWDCKVMRKHEMNHHRKNDAIASFETYRSRRREARLYATFLASTLPLITFVLSLAAGNGAVNLPLRTALAYAVIAAAATLAIFWNPISSRLRFCVIFFPNRVQFGRWLARREFVYQDVEIIYLFSGPIIKVRCGTKTAEVYLDEQNKPTCLILLRSLCSNAIVVDSKQEGHLPANPQHFDKPLYTMERYYRRKTFRFAFLVCYLTAIFSFLAWGLFGWWNGNNILRIILGETLFHVLVGFGVVSVAGIAWKSWRTAVNIRNKRKLLSSSENLIEKQYIVR